MSAGQQTTPLSTSGAPASSTNNPQQQQQQQRPGGSHHFQLSNETRNAMTDAKTSAAIFAKHVADSAAAYESGCRGTNGVASQAKRLTPNIDAFAAAVADATATAEGAVRHCVSGPEAARSMAHLRRHQQDVLPKQSALVGSCAEQLSAALAKATLHKAAA